MAQGPLSDVRVLDLGHSIAGPYCSKLFGDYGADVIKIEAPGCGDPARSHGPFKDDVPNPEGGGLFLHLNTNKRGVTLDIASEDGAALLRRLVGWADVIVENSDPGYLAALGLGFDDLSGLNSRLVLTSITPFGQSGPYRDWKGADIVAFAASGRMNVHGSPDREPVRYAPDVATFQVASTAAMATMGAIFAARLQGIGQHVDVSAMEALMANVDMGILSFDYSGESAVRANRWAGYPNGAYPSSDGYLLLAAGSDRFFRRLCRAIGRLDLLEDPRWGDVTQRPENQAEFDEYFVPWVLDRTRQEAFETLQEFGVMCAPVLTLEDLQRDPQLVHRRYFVDVDHPMAGRLTYPGAPFKMTKTPWSMRRPAPLLGEHNDEVFGGMLGIDGGELAGLKKRGVV